MTLVRIVNFLMEMCRSFTCDIAASFEVSWKGWSQFSDIPFENVESGGLDISEGAEWASCLQPSAGLEGEMSTGGGRSQ